MKCFAARLACSVAFAFAAELLCAGYTKALVGGALWAAAALSFALPFAGLAGSIWFIEERSSLRRFWLVAAAAVGYAVGTATVMLCWPPS